MHDASLHTQSSMHGGLEYNAFENNVEQARVCGLIANAIFTSTIGMKEANRLFHVHDMPPFSLPPSSRSTLTYTVYQATGVSACVLHPPAPRKATLHEPFLNGQAGASRRSAIEIRQPTPFVDTEAHRHTRTASYKRTPGTQDQHTPNKPLSRPYRWPLSTLHRLRSARLKPKPRRNHGRRSARTICVQD